MIRSSGMIAVLAALTMVAAGCGGGSNDVSVSKVIDTFREQTGKHLIRDANNEAGENGRLVIDPRDDPEHRLFGLFFIDVIPEGIRPPRTPWDGADGIWALRRVYLGRVQLTWIAGERRAVNIQWERLDSALKALA